MPACAAYRTCPLLASALFLLAPAITGAQVSDPYQSLDEWRAGYFDDSHDAAARADQADPDGDGIANLLEYALCTHPLQPNASTAPALGTDGDDLTLTYTCARPDVVYRVEASSNLANWSTEGVDQGTGALGEAVTAIIANGLRDGKFVRLHIEANGEVLIVPLFSEATEQEPAVTVEREEALYTYFSDRARDRHAREDQFQNYEHYLSHYWEHRTAEVEIIDRVAKGGDTITFKVRAPWKFKQQQAELRFFYRGIGTVAEYYDNGSMIEMDYNPADGPFFAHYPDDLSPPTPDTRYYTRSVSYNAKEQRPIQVGDRLEFELSQFLDSPPRGRENYYGTTYLYIVGEGLVPWFTVGVFGDASTEREDSYKVNPVAWLGGKTTLHYNVSDEPENAFMQMATNLAPVNGQRFVLGRRLHHTDFGDGSHDEPVDNPPFLEMVGKLGDRYTNRSCVACHDRNGRALPPPINAALEQYVVRVGDLNGGPHPAAGHVLQPKRIGDAAPEGSATISAWEEVDGLRRPVYHFTGVTPERHSIRIAPQLVGMGLLEAIPEAAIAAQADPADADGDGISGRMHGVRDPETGQLRLGRFGWKAAQPSVRAQVAAALNTDMGVMTSVFSTPDSGATLPPEEATGNELAEAHLEHLTAYVSLLGVHPQRDYDDPQVMLGKALFAQARCIDCHTPSYTTSPHARHAELRNQTIHPYTDLLLHDMGPGLADSLGEGDAVGSEWRTAPLWGIGLTAGVSGGEGYLHDGRARTIEEAILWHGGEAEAARQHYEALTQEEKDALLAFIKSL